jgi:F-box/leucine-rich repeat protein 2/20
LSQVLRSLLLNFTDEESWTIKKSINLHQHNLDTGTEITNAVVQEVCCMKPDVYSLNLKKCTSVTDIGLWAIARYCTNLKELTLSQCDGITNIGLRSLAMKCTGIENLDFTNCRNLDDHALRVIAAGMWGLKTFTLTGCNNITDSGIAEVARCCHHLVELDVSNCAKVGEYGDKALLEVGKYCHDLKTLNMFGCNHVADAGIKAIANGCRQIENLQLTGCRELSGSAVKALAQHCPELRNLSIANCQKIQNKDLAKLAKHCRKLENLDISECSNITYKGIQVLAQNCSEMITLNLSACAAVDDEALRVLSKDVVGLRNLNLANCSAITEAGIKEIAYGCTGIGFLNVTNCKNISRRFLMHLIRDMQFSDPAHTYFGYQPKPDADELRQKAMELQMKGKAAIHVQRLIRGTLARGGVREIRRAWIIQNLLPKAQAWIRGHVRRKVWKALLRDRLEHWAASAIRAAWRGMLDRSVVTKMLRIKANYDDRELMSKNIQRVWRGHVGRLVMWTVRDELARIQLKQAQERARLERAATVIERARRGYVARVITDEMRAERERMRALELLRIRCSLVIQRIFRGLLGRTKAKAARAAKELAELRWRCARKIEACWRGKLGRDEARRLREFRDYERAMLAATAIQSCWRGFRGKYLGKVAASLAGLRALEQTAAKKIQSTFRAKLGRDKTKDKREKMAATLKRMRSVQIMQRLYRGHAGRTRAAIQKALKKLEHRAKPLFKKLKDEEVELQVVRDKITYIQGVLAPLAEDTKVLEKEIALILRSKAKYWDSDRISGAPQRFVTEWLKVRLDEKLKESKDRVEELDDQIAELQIKEREKQRHIRHVSRELVPLTTGTIEKTKYERSNFLRHKVRAEQAASIDIQRRFRGYWVRGAIYSEDRDFWVEDYDTTTGQNLYINSWSNETRWRKPLSLKFNEVFHIGEKLGGGSGEEMKKAGGWVEMKDVQHNLVYYYNNSANLYRWCEPSEFVDEHEETNSDWFDAQDLEGLLQNAAPSGKDIGSWNEMIDSDVGEVFYANKYNSEVRWSLSPRSAFKKPKADELALMEASMASGGDEGGGDGGDDEEEEIVIGDWRRVSGSEGIFYINDATDDSQWDPPQEFIDAGYT